MSPLEFPSPPLAVVSEVLVGSVDTVEEADVVAVPEFASLLVVVPSSLLLEVVVDEDEEAFFILGCVPPFPSSPRRLPSPLGLTGH